MCKEGESAETMWAKQEVRLSVEEARSRNSQDEREREKLELGHNHWNGAMMGCVWNFNFQNLKLENQFLFFSPSLCLHFRICFLCFPVFLFCYFAPLFLFAITPRMSYSFDLF